MSKRVRVQTGCANCRRCTNSAAAEGGRRAGRLLVGAMTVGMSEGARLATGNCRACGHKMSLHTPTTQTVGTVPATTGTAPPAPVAAGGANGWADYAGPSQATLDGLEQRLNTAKAAHAKWVAKAEKAEHRHRDKEARSAREQVDRIANQIGLYTRQLDGMTNTASTPPENTAAAEHESPPLPTTPGTALPPAEDLATQLARLGDLKAAGVLTEEEFTAAKARLLG